MEKTQVSLNADGTETMSKVELPDDFFSQVSSDKPSDTDRITALENAVSSLMGV